MSTAKPKYRYLKISIILMLVSALLGLVVWQYWLNTLQDKQHKEITDIISSTVKEQANNNLLLPQIIFINADSSSKKELNDKLIEQISEILTKKYLTNDTSKFNDIELKPFFVLPNKPNKNGYYTLTETQLNELKAHIDFLTKQVDLEIDKAKEEVGRDIDRLNMWVTIWIGVIGFLGIFIPIIINVDTTRNAEIANEKAELASTKATEAISKINDAQPKIDKIDNIEGRIDTSETKIGEIESKANQAEKKAEKAQSKSDALHLVYAIDKLDSVEPENIKYVDRDKWIPHFKKTLLAIKQSLDECKIQHDGEIIKDSLRKMVIRLSRISFQKFLKVENTESINTYLELITRTMNTNYNQEDFEKIIIGLETLANNLKKE
jgi:hypothetical protein